MYTGSMQSFVNTEGNLNGAKRIKPVKYQLNWKDISEN